ncbi:MAG: rhodanese-like domain-containing protein [Candidatus Pacebacteria bacterium]|nr:rhodanese-like domain-containing protein [Candidatus Paceibacterota bacterium]
MKKNIIYIISAVISLFVSVTVIGLYHFMQQQDSQLQTHYYRSEVATLESPHGIRKAIQQRKDDFILVDVRSAQEYEQEHIIGAVNVPVYRDPDTSAYDEEERIIMEFRDVINKNPDKKVIIYCYSTSCMSGRKIGNMLADNGIFVKELGIGWNEWRYDWNMWNYPHEWETTNVEDYIYSGKEPGVYTKLDDIGEAGCSLSKSFEC